MPYRLPKFMEREARIVWFFTFKQFAYVLVAGAIGFLLYFTLGEKNLFLFLVSLIVVMATAFAFAFLKIKGMTLAAFLGSSLSFSISPKKYLWEKKRIIPKVRKRKKIEEKVKEAPPLRVIEGSRLKELSIELETKR